MPKGEVRGLAKGEERKRSSMSGPDDTIGGTVEPESESESEKRSSMSGPDDTIGGTLEPEREHWMHKN